jgi:glycosyltransferase involved in cell wall biosynthesis
MLENWSLKHKALKKKFVWYLYQKKDLQNCIAFCVTSNQEAESIRKLGFKQPIAVIPNGVDLPNLVPRKESENKVHYALFLSRLNPKKGVLDLIEAWNRLIKYGNKQIHNWQLKIVGPDEEGYKADVLRAIGEHNLQKKIIVLEPVYGDEKQKLFSEADLFILPTYSENFGNVIVEALAAEIPVITTKGAPWSELEEYQCGWWTDIGVEGCINALTKALALNDKERREMGKRGRKLVETKYSWASIAEKMISFYQWIINCGKKPGFVIDD